MKTSRNQTRNIGNQLKSASVALTNARTDANINAVLTNYGFSTTRLDEGQTLYETATSKVAAATAGRGRYLAAGEDAAKARKAVMRAYQDLARVARALFVDSPGMLGTLGLSQPMPRLNGPLLAAAQTLFNYGDYPAEVATALSTHGYSAPNLAAEKAKVDAFAAALAAQGEGRGTAQQARRNQTEALVTMRKWMAKFRKIAKVALGNRPKDLEKLGIVTLVQPTPAQLRGRRQAAETRRLKKQAAQATLLKAA